MVVMRFLSAGFVFFSMFRMLFGLLCDLLLVFMVKEKKDFVSS